MWIVPPVSNLQYFWYQWISHIPFWITLLALWRTVREPSDNKAALIILVNWSHGELIWWLQKRQTEQVSILSTVCLDILCPVLNTWAIKYDLIPTHVFCWPSYSTAWHQARHAYYSYMSEIGIIAATWHGKCVRPVSKLITGSDSGSTLS